ncbi:MAG: hypothetical protein D6719_04725 [Candidatus Dadabacteria bacterium]|nr:MAG: hypothetical protein D6719_04725 [Candidatus Dadabacteria bacterium]
MPLPPPAEPAKPKKIEQPGPSYRITIYRPLRQGYGGQAGVDLRGNSWVTKLVINFTLPK